jgi:hypothetical protein
MSRRNMFPSLSKGVGGGKPDTAAESVFDIGSTGDNGQCLAEGTGLEVWRADGRLPMKGGMGNEAYVSYLGARLLDVISINLYLSTREM